MDFLFNFCVQIDFFSKCFVPECERAFDTKYEQPWLNWAIPQESDSDQVIGFKSDSCDRFSVNWTAWNLNKTCSKDTFDTSQVVKCSQWIFDDFERTIINDWNITCTDNQWKISLIGSSHFAGIIIGSALFGILADRFGRKLVFIFCIILMTASGVAQVISPEYITFVTLVFVNALGTAGVYPLAFIIGVEMVGKRKREITGIVLNYFYALGEALVALVAWLTKDWVLLQLIVSAPSLLFVVYYWIIPESVRWLMAKSENGKAKKIVEKVAKINKVTLSTTLIDSFQESKYNHGENSSERENMFPVIKEMLKSRKLVCRFLIVFYVWAVNAFVFYGLSINATTLSGDKYVNFALVSLIEIPGYSLAWICIQKLGRKPSLILSLLLSGITCTLTIFVTNVGNNWEVITLFLLGKLGITSAFGVAYVHTAEMLPTIIRSGGVGLASTCARFGALLAPFVPLLGVYYKPLPMIMFGGLAILAGMLATKLPETHEIKLPETALEAEEL